MAVYTRWQRPPRHRALSCITAHATIWPMTTTRMFHGRAWDRTMLVTAGMLVPWSFSFPSACTIPAISHFCHILLIRDLSEFGSFFTNSSAAAQKCSACNCLACLNCQQTNQPMTDCHVQTMLTCRIVRCLWALLQVAASAKLS